MPHFDSTLFFVAACAVVFAGVSKGGFGSAAAFASASILALVVEPGVALGIMLPLLILIDGVTLRPFWRQWHVPSVRVLILSGIPGVVLGALFYTLVNADVLRVLIGLVSIGFVVWQVVPRATPRSGGVGPASGSLAGAAAGFTSFISHAGGPIAAVYLLGQGLSKTQYQATTVIVFGALNVVKAVPYAALGMFTADTMALNLALAPFALIGAWAGVKLHHLISERAFFGLTYILLLTTGAKLIWDGLA